MPRPKSKIELLELSKTNFSKLNNLVDSYGTEELEREFPKGTLNRNIKDVIAHLHHWHLLLLGWYKVGMQGGNPEMPFKGYTWKTLPQLNMEIQREYEEMDLVKARILLNGSFQKVQILIESHTNKELFEKKKYTWTGSTSLGAYLISNTSSHYDWAIKLIRKSIKRK